ncbi:CLUMA_CG000606, isoform A [Clunio marinus]|uniref:CLUMA_CG000606, isoform A n=1 Tax=Clunio marinus TaxID=568069 RepID=A0A1J1HJX7_9DIPT|nr:CLUMA_CG000606, isoform A [Clunio marinus]
MKISSLLNKEEVLVTLVLHSLQFQVAVRRFRVPLRKRLLDNKQQSSTIQMTTKIKITQNLPLLSKTGIIKILQSCLRENCISEIRT